MTTQSQEWNAGGYSSISSLQAAMAAEVLALLKLEGSEDVLDIGCGDGKVTAQIASRVPRGSVIGVDASHQMVEFASAHFGPERWPNLKFQVADAQGLGFSNRFDLVVSFNALHWVPEQDIALRAIAKALRPGGIAQLRLVPTGERKSLEAVLEETRQSPRWSRYFEDFRDPYLRLTAEEYAAVAERSGLQVLRIGTASKEWDFEDRAAFAAFGAVTFVRWTQRIPDAERPAFIDDVLDRYQAAIDSGGNIFIFYQMDITASRPDTRRSAAPSPQPLTGQ